MDILTQGVLGATVAQSAAKKEHVRWATLIGFFSGMLADLDVLIRSKTDPLLFLEYHRHFTHSIIFIPVGALLAFLLFWPILRNKLPARYIYLYCLLGFLLSGFIDACTSYGTHLLWPFSDERISWHIISIIDPVFTGVLLCLLFIGFKVYRNDVAQFALVFIAGYLLVANIQLQRAEFHIHALAEKRYHIIEKIIVKPTLGNILLWRSVYLSDGIFYIDAVHVGMNKRIYEGESIEQFNIDKALPDLALDSTHYKDIKRFEFFSDGYLTPHPYQSNVIGDIRYSMSPIGITPLWGIETNLDNINQHVKFENYRDSSKEMRQKFIDMVLGKPIDS